MTRRRDEQDRQRNIERLEREIELKLQRCIENLIGIDGLQHDIERLRSKDPEFDEGFDRTVALGLITGHLAELCPAKLWVVLKLAGVVGEIAHLDPAQHKPEGDPPAVHCGGWRQSASTSVVASAPCPNAGPYIRWRWAFRSDSLEGRPQRLSAKSSAL